MFAVHNIVRDIHVNTFFTNLHTEPIKHPDQCRLDIMYLGMYTYRF